MAIEKLRVTRNPHEIRSFFREYIRLKCPVLLWQNMGGAGQSNAKRVIFQGLFVLLNEKKDFVVLTYKTDKNQPIDFDTSSTLYIKGNVQSILFKVDITHYSEGKILIALPSEVRVCEKRERARINFGYNYDGKVEFFNYKAYRSKRKHSSAKLVDVSQGGVAILMFTGKAHSWSPGDTFHIVSINGYEFPEPITGEIRYIRTIRITRNNQGVNAYRLGIQFERELTSQELTRILKQSLQQDSEDEEQAG